MSETACIIQADWIVSFRDRIKRQTAEYVLLNGATNSSGESVIEVYTHFVTVSDVKTFHPH